MTKPKRLLFLTQSAMTAAIYVVLTFLFAPFGFGEIQIRISEMLTILPAFTPAAVPGLFIGCLIGNILGGGILPDIIFGSLATMIGAAGTYAVSVCLRKKASGRHLFFLLPAPPIAANILIIPFVLRFGYGTNLPVPLLMLTVGTGEIISCGVLGLILYRMLSKYRRAGVKFL